MTRKSLMAVLLGMTLASTGATLYAQEAPKPESPIRKLPHRSPGART